MNTTLNKHEDIFKQWFEQHEEQDSKAPPPGFEIQPVTVGVRGEQTFVLKTMQAYNWGTFDGLVTVDVPESGILFTGASGAGKSTLLDAHTALLTPPSFIRFNAAGSEDKKTKDRSLMSYMRGLTGSKTDDDNQSKAEFLRPGATWSVIAETYENEMGQVLTLAQVLWVRDRSVSSEDLQRRFVLLDGPLQLQALEPFAQSQFETRKLKELVGQFKGQVFDAFKPYCELAMKRLNIRDLSALRLLHKAQGLKDAGNLSKFLQEYMLNEPDLGDTPQMLVADFAELNGAYAQVLEAKSKIAVLAPASVALEKYRTQQNRLDSKKAKDSHLEHFKAQKKLSLLQLRSDGLKSVTENLQTQLNEVTAQKQQVDAQLYELSLALSAAGGDRLAVLESELQNAQKALTHRAEQLQQVQSWLALVGLSLSSVTACDYGAVCAQLENQLQASQAEILIKAEQEYQLRTQVDQARKTLLELDNELREVQSRKTNIRPDSLRIRDAICTAVGLDTKDLPFAAELMDVAEVHLPWKGAIERLMHSFSLTLLVPEQHLAQVRQYVNNTFLKGQLSFESIGATSTRGSVASANSVASRLVFQGEPLFQNWLRQAVSERFGAFVCVGSAGELDQVNRGLTQEGLIKWGQRSYQKNDSFNVQDSYHWVMGFSVATRLKRLGEMIEQAYNREQQASIALKQLQSEMAQLRNSLGFADKILQKQFSELDVPSAQADVSRCLGQIEAFNKQFPNLEAQKEEQRSLQAQSNALAQQLANCQSEMGRAQGQLEQVLAQCAHYQGALLTDGVDDAALAGLTRDFVEACEGNEVDSLDLPNNVVRLEAQFSKLTLLLQNEERSIQTSMGSFRREIEHAFKEYTTRYPLETQDFRADLEDRAQFMAILNSLQEENLPKFEGNFRKLLNTQSVQHIISLRHQLETELNSIDQQIRRINETLKKTEFNVGTYLQLQVHRKFTETFKGFNELLKKASENVSDTSEQAMAKRFELISGVVSALENAGKSTLKDADILDVRQQVAFKALELWAHDASQKESYDSSGGKSGGQRQKLTAIILAAALRYQLGHDKTGYLSLATLVIDEAFDKADADFTRQAMQAFEQFGFQMVVANPLKSIQPLEPFIGAGAYVFIHDNRSAIVVLGYDTHERMLLMPTGQSAREFDETADSTLSLGFGARNTQPATKAVGA